MNRDLDSLNDILKRIEQIERFAQDGREAFFQSEMMQEAIIRGFSVIGEAVKRLSPELRQQYPEISWRQMAGFSRCFNS